MMDDYLFSVLRPSPNEAPYPWGAAVLNSFRRVSRFSWLPAMRTLNLTRRPLFFVGLSPVHKIDPDRSLCFCWLSFRDLGRLKWSDLRMRLSWEPRFYAEIMDLLGDDSDVFESDALYRAAQIVNRVKPETIVLSNGTDPINRLFALVGKQNKIRTLILQHGVYSSQADPCGFDGDVADAIFVLDGVQSNILAPSIPKHKHINLGSPSSFSASLSAGCCVGFVGTDIENQGFVQQKTAILASYNRIAARLRELGLKVCYRPHPSESYDGRGGLESSRTECDLYVGFYSTFLKECCERSIPAIQIRSRFYDMESFESMGYCRSVETEKEVVDLVAEILKEKVLFPRVVTDYSVARKFICEYLERL